MMRLVAQYALVAIFTVAMLCGGALTIKRVGDLMDSAEDREHVISDRDPRCDTGAVYEAMSEAYAARRPDPCNGATEWVR